MIFILICNLLQAQNKKQIKSNGKINSLSVVVNSDRQTDAWDNPETEIDESSDGICADSTGNCTITAATQEADFMDLAVDITFSSSMTINLNPDDAYLGILHYGSKINAGGNKISINGNPFAGPLSLSDNCEITGLSLKNIPVELGNGNIIKGCTFENTGMFPVGFLAVDGSNNIIGGKSPSDRNVFMNSKTFAIAFAQANGDGLNQVIGNFIGVDESGSIGKGNFGGILISGENGEGRNVIEDNIISGSSSNGISFLNSDNNVIRNNNIGTNSSGNFSIANAQNGISLLNSSSNIIEQNVISGNSLNGILLMEMVLVPKVHHIIKSISIL